MRVFVVEQNAQGDVADAFEILQAATIIERNLTLIVDGDADLAAIGLGDGDIPAQHDADLIGVNAPVLEEDLQIEGGIELTSHTDDHGHGAADFTVGIGKAEVALLAQCWERDDGVGRAGQRVDVAGHMGDGAGGEIGLDRKSTV